MNFVNHRTSTAQAHQAARRVDSNKHIRRPIAPSNSEILRNLSLVKMLRLAEEDPMRAISGCHERLIAAQRGLQSVRKENMAVGVGIYWSIARDHTKLGDLAEKLEICYERKLKPGKLLRDIFIAMNVDEETAGTDAMALQEALRRRIPSGGISSYLRKGGGKDKLLTKERERRKSISPDESRESSGKHSDRIPVRERRDGRRSTDKSPPGLRGLDKLEFLASAEKRATITGLAHRATLWVRIGRHGNDLHVVEIDPRG